MVIDANPAIMGRSNPTYRNLLDDFEEKLRPFYRTMRRRHQSAFDRAFEHTHLRSAPAGMVNHPDPEFLAVFSMLVGVQQDVLEVRNELGMEHDPLRGARPEE